VVQAQRLFPIFGFTDQVKVAFLFRQPSYGFSEPRIVIDEQYI
jgi:hypothetical protein